MKYTIFVARVLLLTHIYPPAVDGGSRVIAKIGEYLSSHNHQILVITTNCTSTDDFSKNKHPIIKHPASILSQPVITIFHRPFKFLGKLFPSLKVFSKGPIFSPISTLKIIIKSIAFKPDLIIAGPLPTTISLYASFLKYLTYSKLLICPCFHPSDTDFNNKFLLKSLNKTDYLWCLTDYEQKYLSQKLLINRPIFFNSGLGVDNNFITQKFSTPPAIPQILFIANFAAHKRVEILLQAFEMLLKDYPKAKLKLLGQKTLYYPQINHYFRSLPLKTRKQIKFVFNPSKELIKSNIDQSSILVLPSIQESFGLVFVESLARAKPVIGASTPQTKEVINKLGGGLIFEKDNSKDLYEKIKILLTDKNIYQKLSLNGYKSVKNNYTWDKIGKNLCQKLAI